ncbi:hypothetical protein AN926_09855 [Thermus scotoductus]|uniref:Helix-turn-helix type 11 domain-containing protein n=1 Tax=Thermus scotoductus TaxID=37636 RepID=A0A0N0IQ21_THESC|nr:hypothetical protein AN926_09855 [Thermus scotoductus]
MARLLDLLTEDHQSGEALAQRLKVSRQAVSKEAKKLLAEGFPVEMSRKGYRIRPGTPFPTSSTPQGASAGPTATWGGWEAPRMS